MGSSLPTEDQSAHVIETYAIPGSRIPGSWPHF